jgi:hypothetical protein
MPVDPQGLSTICIPCENGSAKGENRLVHDIHIPYDYNEVFLND